MKNRKISKNKTIIIVMSAVWLLIAAAIFYLTLTAGAASSARRIPVYRVVSAEKKAAITFNCAWDDSTTDSVLQTLRERNVKCTFFFVGDYTRKYPEDVRKIVNDGHEPANHSDKHAYPSRQSYSELLADITNCNDEIKKLTGLDCKLYRAPSGEYTNDCIEAAESLGMTTVQWNADSIDWKGKTPAEIAKRIHDSTVPGSIILFHLGKENTAKALPQIIDSLINDGYELVTVSSLLPGGGYEILHDGAAKPLSGQTQQEKNSRQAQVD